MKSHFDYSDIVDDTPKIVAGIVLGAFLALVALRQFGFRFAVGVGT